VARQSKDSALLRQEFLALIAEGYGIKESCSQLGFSTQSYYNWRKKNDAFREACDAVLSDPIHKERILSGAAKADVAVGATWQQKFIALYRRTGDRVAAASQSGVEAVDVENSLDKDHDDYDEQFAYDFQEEQQKKLWKIEDNMMKKAEHDAPTSRFALSNLMKEKYGKVGGEVTVNQLHWFTERDTGSARDLLSDLFSPPASPEAQLGSIVSDSGGDSE